ncbi:MAG: serine/threonine protein kinase [Chloroflexi bacterium]|nr:serine/threonine protein kinase [Chloroflexota bacterium]
MNRTTIGKYIGLELIGQGGMAEVYIGLDPTLNRRVAIKLILPHFADKSDFEARFQREAETIASLRHANIVHIYEYSIEDGTPFMVMEYLDGGTLGDKLTKYETMGSVMPLEETAAILDKVASGLDYAHQRGLIHRDIKPANVLFSEDGEPIIADFGIVKLLGDTLALTQTGGVVGSPRYLPPEQATQQEIDKRSDIYSLGIVLYQMVTGTVPFDGDMINVMMQHVNERPANPTTINADLPESTAEVILKALEKKPQYRYDSAGEMAVAFRNSLTKTAGLTFPLPAETTVPVTKIVSIPEETLVLAPTVKATPQAKKPSAKPISGKLIGGIVALLLIALLAFIVFGDGFSGTAEETPTAEVANVVGNDVAATAVTDQPEEVPTPIPIDTTIPHGDITFHGDTVTVSLNDLKPTDEGVIYAVWLTEPDAAPLHLGGIEADGGELFFTDPAGGDVLMNFSGFAITETPASDAEAVFNGPIIYEALAAEQIISDYRHFQDTFGVPFDQAIGDNMALQANTFTDHTGFSLVAILTDGSLDDGKTHAEHTINVASGMGSDDYFDWDGSGRPENPGDDVGLLTYIRLFANAISSTDANTAAEADELITQIESHVSLMKKITASDTLDEAAAHAEQLDVQQGQILEKITVLLAETGTFDFSTHLEVFATEN